ncbi:hypothetical protein FRC03_007597 [Tulasnella sp. 419]|nr:hypothetical protein FRC03_007597 [Tulasnella sp. 419]
MTVLELQDLPEDVIIEILVFLTVKDILRSRRLSKRFRHITSLRAVWLNAALYQVIGRGLSLPIQPTPLNEIGPKELEGLVVKATKLERNLLSALPLPTQTLLFEERVRNCYITQIFILPGYGGRWIISVASGRFLTCWEILEDPLGALVAATWDNPGNILDVVVNSLPGHEGVVAIASHRQGQFTAEVLSLKSLQCGEVSVFEVIHNYPSFPGRLKLFKGDLLITFRGRSGICIFINWKTGFTAQLDTRALDGGEWEGARQCLAVEILRNFVIILTQVGYYIFKVDADVTLHKSSAYAPVYRFLWGDLDPRAATICKFPLDHTGNSFNLCILLRNKERTRSNEDHVTQWLLPHLDLDYLELQPRDWPNPILISTAVTGSHFQPDLHCGSSGRGFWMQKIVSNPESARMEMAMDNAVHATRAELPEETPVSFDFSNRHFQMRSHWIPGISSPMKVNYPSTGDFSISRCTAMAYEDTVGRLVTGSFDGKVRLIDYA